MGKDLEEIKNKLAKSEQSQKTLKVEVDNLESELQKLKDRRETLLKQYSTIAKRNETQESDLTDLENEIRITQDNYDKICAQ